MQTTDIKDDFKFFLPANFIEKGKNEKGEERMVIKGLASTGTEDSDGEYLDPQGFDLSEFAYLNWNHGKTPGAIVGEPIDWEVKPEGLSIEGELYPDQPMAKEVWDLGKALKKSKRGNQLGFSVEGKVLQRDPTNENKVLKAKITQLAICPHPKNADTWADFMTKGYTDTWEVTEDNVDVANGGNEEYLIDLTDENGNRIILDKNFRIRVTKAMSAESPSGQAVTKESMDGGHKKVRKNFADQEEDNNFTKNFNKSELFGVIFNQIPGIRIDKARTIYKIADKMSEQEGKTTNEDYVLKAINYLEEIGQKVGDQQNGNGDLSKGNGYPNSEEPRKKTETGDFADGSVTPGAQESGRQKLLNAAVEKAKTLMKDEMSKSDIVSKMKEEGYDDETIDKAYQYAASSSEKSENGESIDDQILRKQKELEDLQKSKNGEGEGQGNGNNDELIKAINSLTEEQRENFKQVGKITKGLYDQQKEIEKSQDELGERINKLEEQPVGGKAQTVSKSYKPRPDEEVGGNGGDQLGGQQGQGQQSQMSLSVSNPDHRSKLSKALQNEIDLQKADTEGMSKEETQLLDEIQKFETTGKVGRNMLSKAQELGIQVTK